MSAYSIVTFHEFVAFAAQQPELFESLFEQREREISESDLTAMVERYRRRDNISNVSTATVVRKLKDLRVLEDSGAGEFGTSYRYADPLVDLHEYLAQTLAPISPESIEGAIISLKKLIAEMEQARIEFSADGVENRAREMRQRSSQVLKGIEANYHHIMNEAAAIRGDALQLTARERFGRLERAWNTYIAPLVEIVRVNGIIEQVLQDAERAVERAEEDGLFSVPAQADLTLRRFLLLRQRSNVRIQDCVQTIRPILEKHMRQTLASEGAAMVIDRLLQHGVTGQGIERLMPTMWVSPRDQYNDDQIASCAKNISQIVPQDPPVLQLGLSTVVDLPDHADPTAIMETIEALRAAGTVPDIWEFIRTRRPDRSSLHTLAAFYNIQSDLKGAEVQFTGYVKDYEFPESRLTAGVISITFPK